MKKSVNLKKQEKNKIAQVQNGEPKDDVNQLKSLIEKENQSTNSSVYELKTETTPTVPENHTGSSNSNLTSVKVPKKEAVISSNQKLSKLEERKIKRQLEKEKQKLEKQKRKKLLEKNKFELEKLKQQRERQKALTLKEKIKQKEEQFKKKELKRQEKLDRKEQKRKEKEYQQKQKKDYGLNDLDALEKRVLKRKEEDDEHKKRFLIIILILLLICLISFGSCTVVDIIEDQKPEPVKVDIVLESEDLEPLIPIDPENPDAGYLDIIVYPGDTLHIECYVYNNEVTQAFPVYVRFRTYIIIDDLTEHSVFEINFDNPSLWYNWNNSVDDWYYYGGLLDVGIENKLKIVNSLKLRTDLDNRYQGKEFLVVFRIESIQGTPEAVSFFESWWSAPQDWFDLMGIDPIA